MLPNLVIAGMPKAATSSLFRWLDDHPQAAGASEKETYYFVDPGTHMFSPDRHVSTGGLAGYEAYFAHCDPGAKIVFEATPSYLYSREARERLPVLPSRPDFLFVLREPVAQVRSLFTYFQHNWNWIPRDMDFADFVHAVRRGEARFKGNELAQHALEYAWVSAPLRDWRARVGAERMHVTLFDDLVKDAARFMPALARRLGIDPEFYADYDYPGENLTYAARFGPLQDANIWLRERLPKGPVYDVLRGAYRRLNTRPVDRERTPRDVAVEQELAEHFAPLIDELERDFGLDLARWRRVPAARSEPLAEAVGA